MLKSSKGKMKISGHYLVKQPIENFKIRVRIAQQKSPLAELFENEEETRDGNFLVHEERAFAWQEKVLGPYEARYYRDVANCPTDRQMEYHRRLTAAGESPGVREGSRLYSYVQGDDWYCCPAADEGPLCTGRFRSALAVRAERAAAAPAVRNRKPFAERHNKRVVDERPADRRIAENHYLYRERESMYIVADLSAKDEASLEAADSEVLLCAIHYDRLRGRLVVSPDFARRDGCGYSVEGTGMGYDYWIELASAGPRPRELQRRRELDKREAQRLLHLKDAQLFHELVSPQPRVLRLQLNLDVCAARDFGYDDGLFVSYALDLPRHWRVSGEEPRARATGRTQRCRARAGRANFAHCAEVQLDLDLAALLAGQEELEEGREQGGAGVPSWPTLLVSVGSLDSWTRYRIEGYASLSLPPLPGQYEVELRTWRPAGGPIDALRRFFTGGSRELEDLSYCGVPQAGGDGDHRPMDKSGLRVAPSGVVELRLGLAHQSQSFAGEYEEEPGPEEVGRASAARRLLGSVDDVLGRFKAARERMIRARAGAACS